MRLQALRGGKGEQIVESLRDALRDYSDEQLLDQYFNHREDYTEEALNVMKDEIARRGIDEKDVQKEMLEKGESIASMPGNLGKEDFGVLEHGFQRADILTAYAILRDSDIVFYIDNPESEEEQPLYKINVLKSSFDQARDLLEEHFVPGEEGNYVLRDSDLKTRLKAFSFSDVHISDKAAREQLEVSFSEEERAEFAQLGERLLREADTIEEEQERVIFFYDSLEEMIEKLKEQKVLKLTRTDLLTILEVCQIYCDDPQFPHVLDGTVASLLSFFYGQEI
ncbi:MAG: hypothetical protein ACOC36_01285 [Fibrobacterota bacterium]